MTKLLTIALVLAVALMASVAQALLDPTAADVEAVVETAVGGVAATYMELTKSGVGNTREGLTLVTDDNTWAYPDSSDGDVAVNGNCLDEDPWNGGSGTGAADFKATISGLVADAEYGVYVLAFGRGNATEDFAWGTEADGSPVNTVSDISYVVENGGGIGIAGPTGGDVVYNNAVSLGNLTADENGEMVIWLGKAGTFADPDYRTQLDGILVTREVLSAYNPDPADDATHVSVGTDLEWSVPTDANVNADTDWEYDVYFSTDSAFTSVTPITVGPEVAGARLTVTNAQLGGNLALDTEYFWRVNVVDPNGPTTRIGSLWSFEAGCTLPVLVAPADTEDPTVEIDVDLEWTSDAISSDASKVIITPDGESAVDAGEQTSPFNPWAVLGEPTMEWNKKYTWQVLELDAGDNVIATGPAWTFVVRKLNCPDTTADIAGEDCIVDLADFAEMASQWLKCDADDGGKASPCP